MIRTNVESSQIASIGFDSGTLEIEFTGKSRSVYQYKNVTPELYNEMIAAESVGKFFYANIKGKFPYAKLIDGVALDWIDPTNQKEKA